MLNREAHIKKSASNMNSKIKQLKRIKSLPSKVLETIYLTGILPGSPYGLSVWGKCSSTQMEHLEKVHRRVARIIHKIPRGADNTDVVQKANWKSIQYMYKRNVICLTHKAYYGNCLDEISNIIEKKWKYMEYERHPKTQLTTTKDRRRKKDFQIQIDATMELTAGEC